MERPEAYSLPWTAQQQSRFGLLLHSSTRADHKAPLVEALPQYPMEAIIQHVSCGTDESSL